MLLLSILCFGTCLKILGKGLLADGFYLVAITETTVGFGDLVPSYWFTQCICVLACFVGLVLISLLVLATQRTIELSDNENLAYNHIKYGADTKVLKTKAAAVIQNWWVLLLKRKKRLPRFNCLIKYFFSVKAFRIRRIQIKSNKHIDLVESISAVDKCSNIMIRGAAKSMVSLNIYRETTKDIIINEINLKKSFENLRNNYRKIVCSVIPDKYSEILHPLTSQIKTGPNLAKIKKLKDKAVKKMLLRLSLSNKNMFENHFK